MTAQDHLAHFDRAVDRCRRVRDVGQSAFASRSIRQTDLDHIYESTFLSAVTAWETFARSLFYSCLMGESGISTKPLVVFDNRPLAERVLLEAAGARFLSWIKLDDLQKRADLLLAGGRPFSRLKFRPQDKQVLDQVRRVRNAIAHKGESARDEFKKISPSGLPPSRRHPAGYLQVMNGNITTHEVYCLAMKRIAAALTASNDHKAEAFLAPEGDYENNQKPGLGTFVCSRCGVPVRIRSKNARLPLCVCAVPCSQCRRHNEKSKYRRK